VNRDQLVRALRRYCRKRGISIAVDKKKGNGSHYRITVADRISTLQMDLNPGRIERFLKQLGIDPADL